MVIIDEQTGSQDGGRGEIGLKLEEITAAEKLVAVGIPGELGDVDVVEFELETVVEPGAVADHGPRKREARNQFIEAQAVDLVKGRNEVGGVEAKIVIAHAGVVGDDSSGGATVLDGVARGLDVDGADSVGADAEGERAAEGRADIKAIEHIERLPGLGAVDVDLLICAFDHAGVVRQKKADVARGRIWDVDDLGRVHNLGVGYLIDVDPGWRSGDADLLVDNLLVGDGHAESGERGADGALRGLIESGLLNRDLVGLCVAGQGEDTAAGEAGPEMNRGTVRLDDCDLGAGDSHAVFIHDGDNNARLKMLTLGGGASDNEEEQQRECGRRRKRAQKAAAVRIGADWNLHPRSAYMPYDAAGERS